VGLRWAVLAIPASTWHFFFPRYCTACLIISSGRGRTVRVGRCIRLARESRMPAQLLSFRRCFQTTGVSLFPAVFFVMTALIRVGRLAWHFSTAAHPRANPVETKVPNTILFRVAGNVPAVYDRLHAVGHFETSRTGRVWKRLHKQNVPRRKYRAPHDKSRAICTQLIVIGANVLISCAAPIPLAERWALRPSISPRSSAKRMAKQGALTGLIQHAHAGKKEDFSP